MSQHKHTGKKGVAMIDRKRFWRMKRRVLLEDSQSWEWEARSNIESGLENETWERTLELTEQDWFIGL